MRILKKQDGIALVTALMFTMISLGIIMALLYYVLAGTRLSASQKRYRSALEASYGGADFVTKTVIPKLFDNYTGGVVGLKNNFSSTSSLGLVVGPNLRQKMETATATWGIARRSTDPKQMTDLTFTLKGQTTGTDYKIYTKITDTIKGSGMIDTGEVATEGGYLDKGAAVSGSSDSIPSPRKPTVYTVEVQSEAAVNPREKAALTVLYAY